MENKLQSYLNDHTIDRSKLKFPDIYTLNDLENLLDRYHRAKKCFNMTDRSELSHFIINLRTFDEENLQLIRIFKKLTWYSAFNLDFSDGRWNQF